MGKFIDLTGQKFGRLTVIERVEDYVSPKGYHEPQWLCECDCEKHNRVIVHRSSLKGGLVQSCGCLKSENTIINNQNKHKVNRYDLSGEYGIGWTYNTNEEFYFDINDYNLIKDYCWRVHTGNTGAKTLVAYNKETQGPIKMTTLFGMKEYDHANRNRLDNRRCNLRLASKSDNARNHSKGINNTSGFIGVSWRKDFQVWSAYIIVNEKQIHLGYFNELTDAVIQRLNAELKYFGEDFAPQRHLFEEYGILINKGEI